MCTYKNMAESSTTTAIQHPLPPRPSDSENANNIFQNIIAVTNRHLCSHPLTEQMVRVCSARPKAVILREKDLTEEEYRTLAIEVLAICKTYDVPCILHTYWNVARELGCPAIHLPLPLLREYSASLPADSPSEPSAFPIIGTSVHSVADALEAENLGSSYLIAGHIYTTDCKKGIPPRGTEFLRKVCKNVSIPVYAIGGIKPDIRQIDEVMSCGAAGGCVMSGMMTL